jgi:hypothetical protein
VLKGRKDKKRRARSKIEKVRWGDRREEGDKTKLLFMPSP